MSALMDNYDIARDTLNTALNESDGSAQKELENWQKGLQYSVDTFTVSLQKLSQAVMDSDFLKGLVDTGTTLVDILGILIDKFGVLTTIGAGAGIFAGFENVGRDEMQSLIVLNCRQ